MRNAVWFGAAIVWASLLAGCDRGFVNRYNESLREVLASRSAGQACGDVRAVLIPQCPVPAVCFTSACDSHDLCYATCGESRTACDIRFYADLVALCLESLPLQDPDLQACLTAASLFWAAVDQFGEGPFEETQTDNGCKDPNPQIIPGACCGGGEQPVCTEADSLSECAFDNIFIPRFTCAEVAERFGGCPVPVNDDCSERSLVCAEPYPDGDAGWCERELEAEDPIRFCSLAAQDCEFGVPCLPLGRPAFRCRVFADNRLATTDGPAAGGDCASSGEDSFQFDVWYEYVAPCTGTLSIRMCEATFYDSMLAVYGPPDTSGICACPRDQQNLLACDDDSCFGVSSPSVLAVPAVQEGGCYVIRVGGWFSADTEFSTGRGAAQLNIGLLCD
jgi:hypothetical protein